MVQGKHYGLGCGEQLAKWIRIRCGGANYTLEEIRGAYEGLCQFTGNDPAHPEVGMDLVKETLDRIHALGFQAGWRQAGVKNVKRKK